MQSSANTVKLPIIKKNRNVTFFIYKKPPKQMNIQTHNTK